MPRSPDLAMFMLMIDDTHFIPSCCPCAHEVNINNVCTGVYTYVTDQIRTIISGRSRIS